MSAPVSASTSAPRRASRLNRRRSLAGWLAVALGRALREYWAILVLGAILLFSMAVGCQGPRPSDAPSAAPLPLRPPGALVSFASPRDAIPAIQAFFAGCADAADAARQALGAFGAGGAPAGSPLVPAAGCPRPLWAPPAEASGVSAAQGRRFVRLDLFRIDLDGDGRIELVALADFDRQRLGLGVFELIGGQLRALDARTVQAAPPGSRGIEFADTTGDGRTEIVWQFALPAPPAYVTARGVTLASDREQTIVFAFVKRRLAPLLDFDARLVRRGAGEPRPFVRETTMRLDPARHALTLDSRTEYVDAAGAPLPGLSSKRTRPFRYELGAGRFVPAGPAGATHVSLSAVSRLRKAYALAYGAPRLAESAAILAAHVRSALARQPGEPLGAALAAERLALRRLVRGEVLRARLDRPPPPVPAD